MGQPADNGPAKSIFKNAGGGGSHIYRRHHKRGVYHSLKKKTNKLNYLMNMNHSTGYKIQQHTC